MTGRIEKTVFISYRRTNVPWALAIYQNLTMHGYDVFFDYQSIDSGNFEKVILENIKTRAHFLVILTPSALERCKEPGDWLRREIETAIDVKRNIVPLMLESFDFGSPLVKEALTGKLAALNTFNGLRVYSEYFFEAMDKLRGRYLNVAVHDISLSQLNIEAKEITDKQKSAANNAASVKKEQLTAQEWFERGYVFQEEKKYTEAFRCYSKAIELDPASNKSYNNLGILLYAQKLYDEAASAYLKALELDPTEATTHYNLGHLQQDRGRPDEAEAAYRKAIELNPSYSTAYSNLGILLKNLNRYDEAESAYLKALELDPADATTYSNLGNLLSDLKRYDEAEAAYRKAIELKPSYVTAYYNLIHLLRTNNKNEGALHLLDSLSEMGPEDFSFWFTKASVYKQLGRKIPNELIEKSRQLIAKNDWYSRACLESVCDNFGLAFEYLQRAAQQGQINPAWVWEDPDLQWIRDDPRFEKIVGSRPE